MTRRCSCAQVMYRNNADGTQSFKLMGKASCTKCQGYGRITTCGACDGCGLRLGCLCPTCCGSGVEAVKA